MARINVEGSLYRGQAFQDLLIKTGSRHTAKGMVLELFETAQEFWYPDRRFIPLDKVKRLGLQPCIDAGLAEVRDGGVYVFGSEDQFAWLFQKQDAGKLSGVKRAQKKSSKKSAPKSNARSTDVNTRSTQPNGTQPPSPSPSPSLTPSLFSSSPPEGNVRSPVGFFIGRYVKAYQKKYGEEARPDLRGEIQGKIKRFLVDTPIERACELIETYCQMQDQWFLTKAHDFDTFIANLSKVGLKLDTGRQITRKDAQMAESRTVWDGLLDEAEDKGGAA
jgi:hypothetical protein